MEGDITVSPKNGIEVQKCSMPQNETAIFLRKFFSCLCLLCLVYKRKCTEPLSTEKFIYTKEDQTESASRVWMVGELLISLCCLEKGQWGLKPPPCHEIPLNLQRHALDFVRLRGKKRMFYCLYLPRIRLKKLFFKQWETRPQHAECSLWTAAACNITILSQSLIWITSHKNQRLFSSSIRIGDFFLIWKWKILVHHQQQL